MQKRLILLVFLLLGIILTSGCTSPQSPALVSPVTVTPTISSTVIPVTSNPTATPSPGITFNPEGQQPAPGVVTVQTTRIQVDNPYLEYLNVRKKTLDNYVPNCPMENAFPEIAKDLTYGIKQQYPKLSTLTQDQYDLFLWKYTEGKSEKSLIKNVPGCYGAEGLPNWNFVEIKVILSPTNVRPANYTITQVVQSNGKTIAEFATTRTLVIDEKISLTNYVPVKTDELELLDTVGITYTRH